MSEELASRIVALGVIRKSGPAVDGNFNPTGEYNYCFNGPGGYEPALSADQIVRDGRVVLAMMEGYRWQASVEEWCKFCDRLKHETHSVKYEIGPAILTIICEALENE